MERADQENDEMEFMVIMLTDRETEVDPSVMPETGKFPGELAAA